MATISKTNGKIVSKIKYKGEIYDAGGTNTLKTLLDATKKASYFFEGYKDTSVNGLISYSDTENVTDMSYMFSYCSSLTTIPQLNTSNVTDMSWMFQNCSSLTTIPQLNTSNVTTMRNMFYQCSKLTSIPYLDASNVSNLTNAFESCSNLKEIHMTGMKVSFYIGSSSKFTESALVEILNNLATVTSTQKLTMGSNNLAKLTDEEKAIATNKGWTLS